MFFGTQSIQLDDKNRMRIPVKFRVALGDKFYICQGVHDCLYVMSAAEFEKYLEPLLNIPISDIEAQNAFRTITGTVECPDEDSQYRFVLPQSLKRIASIDKKVVFVGTGKRIEIWSEEKYLENDIGKSGSINRAYETLSRFNF